MKKKSKTNKDTKQSKYSIQSLTSVCTRWWNSTPLQSCGWLYNTLNVFSGTVILKLSRSLLNT